MEGQSTPHGARLANYPLANQPMDNQPNPNQSLTAWQRFWGGTAIGLIGLAFAALYCYGVADAPWPVAGWFLGVGSSSLLGLLAVGLKADPRRMLTALLDSLPG